MGETQHRSGTTSPTPDGRSDRGQEDQAADNHKGATRLEAFSDGVFAIAITLLVLTFKVPAPGDLHGTLFDALLMQWPAYLAYVNSFFAVLLMWVAHHNMFRYIVRTDHVLLLLNGLLLMGTTLVPFPTSLLAQYLQTGTYQDKQTAVAVCCGTFSFIALTYNLIYWWAVSGRRLTDPNMPVELSRARWLSYTLRPWIYIAALALALSPLPFALQVSLAIYTVLALIYALPPPRRHLFAAVPKQHDIHS